ncbi:MAG: DNA double-strand break repair nuclease NurA [Stackebrandtia sp.]
MRISVSAWDPGYVDTGERAAEASRAQLDLDLEKHSDDWTPVAARAAAATPQRVLLVDGVRRIDARVDIAVDGRPPQPGLCASYAAGVVVCDLGCDSPNATVAVDRVERGLFSGVDAEHFASSPSGAAGYPPRRARAEDPGDLVNAVQDRLTDLEVEIASAAEPAAADLLVIDGALRRRDRLRRAVGYIKSHQRRYLPDQQSLIVDKLAPGERTPVFLLGTTWQRHSWYLRLPGGGDGSWAGIARLEAAADLHIDAVVDLADASTAVLPRLASSPHKDPRAPQNLTPIAGLERRLRAKLGDPRLLLRKLRAGGRGLTASRTQE